MLSVPRVALDTDQFIPSHRPPWARSIARRPVPESSANK
ncbi:MAG: hypothetical protein AVDCRST_MAG18-1911 [uncultured Thermomicrobiales bacterium]|uniref:Uncharacterized protein n=1 Tax=uncultured Thermomicrobiales bacterium TaxID=1645740 RepID=A0A6J4V8V4_9BACT|nr:MAG: hypothetical protein AVDCRST_MAG18-1911 [uncultured Thermomicrobiales bacterium]